MYHIKLRICLVLASVIRMILGCHGKLRRCPITGPLRKKGSRSQPLISALDYFVCWWPSWRVMMQAIDSENCDGSSAALLSWSTSFLVSFLLKLTRRINAASATEYLAVSLSSQSLRQMGAR
ncbi:hypothetical protein V8C37DRAFT_369382 [Trichoderma ceciliae]